MNTTDDHHTQSPQRQFLTFRLATETYGVDILRVQEIRGWEPVTRLPNTPDHVRGVLNLRGAVVPVLDLRRRFGLPGQEIGKDTVVIVLRIRGDQGERSMGVVVDAVADVVDASEEALQPAPDFGARIDAQCITGLLNDRGHMVMLLDVDLMPNDAPLKEAA